MSAELRQFVREALIHGMTRTAIRERLLGAGWRPEEVETALDAFAEVESPVPVPCRKPYLSAREAFFYLVLFVTLYITAINVGSVLFQLVNRYFPDAGQERGGIWGTFSSEAVRGAVAGIVIAFPIFLFVSRLIGRVIARDPEKGASKIRKWLTYVTLFVSACVIIADLTYLVTQVLSGELMLRVSLKVIVVLLIAGTIFAHYLSDLRREEDRAELRRTSPSWLARGAAIGTFATLLVGLFLAGSPVAERKRKLDAERVEDLRMIVDAVEEHYVKHRELPASLEALEADPRGQTFDSMDPETGESYGYRIVDSTTYVVSATFAAPDTLVEGVFDHDRAPQFWRHGVGLQTYTITLPPRVLDRSREPREPR